MVLPENTSQQILETLGRARTVLLVCHPGPDGDTMGAACAFTHYLKNLGIPSALFCANGTGERYHFLPHADTLTNDPAVFENETIDVVITFDAGDLDYLGIKNLLPKIPGGATVINIDHHASNVNFGDINLVVTDAASTTALLFEYFNAVEFSIDETLATCLLTGIINDTDHFSNAATTATAMSISSELIARGAKLHTIRQNMINNKSVALLKLWGIALARLYYQPEQKAVITYVTQEDYESFGLKDEDVYGIPNFLNHLGEGDYTLFLKESEDGHVKGSFRTTHEGVDVSKIARQFGGGGHIKASGFKIPGRLQKTENGVRVVNA